MKEKKESTLTPKQKKFCHEYILDYNATQAAIRAGYSKKTAHSIGSENLKKGAISGFIRSLSENLIDKTLVTHQRVFMELVSIMLQNSNLNAKVKAIEIILEKLPQETNDDMMELAYERVTAAIKRIKKGELNEDV